MGDIPSKRPTFAELMVQHEKVFKWPSSVCEVALKRISFLDHDSIVTDIKGHDREYSEALPKLAQYIDIMRNQGKMIIAWEEGGKIGERPEDFPLDLKPDLERVRDIIGKYNYRYYGPCFVEPIIDTKKSLDTLLDNLQYDEKMALIEMLETLTSGLNDPEKNATMIRISKVYGIPLSPTLNLVNMTLQQAEILMATERMESEAADELIEKMKKRG